MDPQLLNYYNQELTYMREAAGEFAQMHPKIARRLGMHGVEVHDPYVERLIESFCFMSARMRTKLDAEFPRFTQRLLEVVYPNYVAPTPSMAVAQLHPSASEGDLSSGFVVPRGSAFYAQVPAGESTACEFRSSQDVTLWPIEIVSAKLAGIPPDIPTLDRYVPPTVQIVGSLRLRLRVKGALNFCDLTGLDRLPIYLSGDEQTASHLYELLHAGAVATLTGVPDHMAEHPHVVSHQALVHEGLEPTQSLLPLPWNTWHGHNLLHEYFSCPSRFYFFALQNLAPGLSRIQGQEAEIIVLLQRDTQRLSGLVDKDQFALFCTPIINLFEQRTDRIELNTQQSEFHLVPDRSRPMDLEVFSVLGMSAQKTDSTQNLEFRPLYQSLNQDEGNHGRYFSLRREPRLVSDSARKYGTRTSYVGTEVFVSLVDQHDAPYSEALRHLSVKALLTNRDLPRLIPRNGRTDLNAADSLPISAIGLIRPPSAPKAPLADGEMAWRLIRQLNFNYLPLHELDVRQGAQALRDMLRLFVGQEDLIANKQIDGLIGSHTTPVTRRLPGTGPLVYGRGVQCDLTVDEDCFSGTSPYLFGLVLENYLARHVSINVFTQTQLQSMQRGRVEQWPVRMGSRGVI
ncbi:type VI secretion system baseplate subunit TssF [Curvibacter sp. CHRR-16]|uniref:type VI secretion system baseplate subunit TssF n=1 Tax=Curvibacter sp. CHRR-16 TaxID=2835872 RepID=UPI001BDB3353|nr:type VI secretion system baseplate subunit TssF [Curvibacter sp. CHRR-16]MBT0571857.1 type VI secretion system baseplate subunit TssF [Curvibacter sp. CHRR-16]